MSPPEDLGTPSTQVSLESPLAVCDPTPGDPGAYLNIAVPNIQKPQRRRGKKKPLVSKGEQDTSLP